MQGMQRWEKKLETQPNQKTIDESVKICPLKMLFWAYYDTL